MSEKYIFHIKIAKITCSKSKYISEYHNPLKPYKIKQIYGQKQSKPMNAKYVVINFLIKKQQ